jgi:predicted metalloprotease with PDZ domain
MRRDVQKIVETEVEIMGGEIPYKDYTFILHLRSNAGGGLEHLNSTSLGYPRFGFKVGREDRATSSGPNTTQQPERDYRGFLSLVAHEFFTCGTSNVFDPMRSVRLITPGRTTRKFSGLLKESLTTTPTLPCDART